MSESWIVRILRALANRVVIISGALLTLLVGVGPPVYNMMSGPSAQAIEADDKLSGLLPAMDAHRRESDLIRMRARRVANAMMRGASVENVQDRFDEFSLAVGDYQTTSNDLERIMKTGFVPPVRCGPTNPRTCLSLDRALRNVLNASARIETCLERGMKRYDARAATYMANRVSATDPEQEIADAEPGAGSPGPSDLNCRAGSGHAPMADQLRAIDACTSAIRVSLVSVRQTLTRSRRENAWQRTFIDLRTAVENAAPQKNDQQTGGVAQLEADHFTLGSDWEKLNKWVATDCAVTVLEARTSGLNGQGRPPWEVRPAVPPVAPPEASPPQPDPTALVVF